MPDVSNCKYIKLKYNVAASAKTGYTRWLRVKSRSFRNVINFPMGFLRININDGYWTFDSSTTFIFIAQTLHSIS